MADPSAGIDLPDPSISIGTPELAEQDQPDLAANGSCQQLRQNLDELAAAGQQTAACLEIKASSSPEEARTLRQSIDRSITEVVPVPQSCWDFAFRGWVASRYYTCRVEEGLLLVFNTGTGAVVGEATFWEVGYEYMDPTIENWAFQIELIFQTISGAAVGSNVVGAANCELECILLGSTFPLQPVTLGLNPQGEAYFTSTIPETGPLAYANSTWTYWVEHPTFGASTPASSTPAWTVRCDSLARPYVGCVVDDYPSTYRTSLSGNAPNYAKHILWAQSYGLPGARGGSGAAPLHRLTNDLLIEQNRNTACPSSLPRPGGHSCDEYPFASTHEGAFTRGGPGRTQSWCQIPALPSPPVPDGYSVCMIPEGENSSGGATLGNFYFDFRIIESEEFWVAVTA